MRRREFITLLATAGGLPGQAFGQGAKRPRIGFLYPGAASASPSRLNAILNGLRSLGYAEPEQIEVISRVSDGDPTRLPSFAAELIREQVEIVIAVSTAAIRAVQAATTAIPIVGHDLETDPVKSGLIESYARPGGQITGVFFDFPEVRGKWLELLQETIPGLNSVGILWDPVSGSAQLEAAESAAERLRLNVKTFEVRTTNDLEDAFVGASREAVGALLILSSPLFGTRPNILAETALRSRIPTMTLFPEFARAGGLMAYGPDILDTYRPIGPLVAKILRGASPAQLPVERPTKFLFVLNLKTAKAIGLTIPTSMLLRADEVIE